jgi:hypothetical protein
MENMTQAQFDDFILSFFQVDEPFSRAAEDLAAFTKNPIADVKESLDRLYANGKICRIARVYGNDAYHKMPRKLTDVELQLTVDDLNKQMTATAEAMKQDARYCVEFTDRYLQYIDCENSYCNLLDADDSLFKHTAQMHRLYREIHGYGGMLSARKATVK